MLDLPILQKIENPFDVLLGNDSAQADSVDVLNRHFHHGGIGKDTQLVKLTGFGTERQRIRKNVLDNSNTMIGIDDFIPDLKGHSHLAFD
jgi:hypothetical protein